MHSNMYPNNQMQRIALKSIVDCIEAHLECIWIALKCIVDGIDLHLGLHCGLH